MMFKSFFLLSIITILSLLSGCIAYSTQKNMPLSESSQSVKNADQGGQEGQNNVQAIAQYSLNISKKGGITEDYLVQLNEQFKQRLAQKGLVPASAESTLPLVKLSYEIDNNFGLTRVVIGSAALFGVVFPFWYDGIYILKAEIAEQSYQSDGRIRTVFWIPFAITAPFINPLTENNKLLDGLVDSVVNQIRAAKVSALSE